VNKQLRRLSGTIFTMFLSLLVSATVIQVMSADTLNNDSRNVRPVYDTYKIKRGAILVNGQPIAESVPSKDGYSYQRVYKGKLYSAVTGFYSLYQGATGIESASNDYLTGKNSSQFFEQINALFSGNPVTGGSVELTIDPKVQKVAYDALGSMHGAVVALDPSTGEILAMVSTPGFDANKLAVHDGKVSGANYQKLLSANGDPLIDKAISGSLYAPGSVFKLVVSAAAIENGDYLPGTKIPNPRKFTLPGTTTDIQNSGEGKCGGGLTVTLADALKLSCNIPFAQVGIKLGQGKIGDMAEKFGFGKSIKIPLVATPSVYPQNLDDAQTALTAFGQYDVRVTPLQIAMVSSAIANGGTLMQPHLVRQVLSSNLAQLAKTSPSVFSTPVSKTTATKLTEMMVAAVNSGVSGNGKIPGVSVAGKTGTAQNGKNAPYTLWFTGFAPAKNPKVAVAVVIADGGGMGQNGRGNSLAAPVARKVMEAVLNR
jgi:peptidoglycan glycosyltransferase